tara:strand:- start:2549 stop:3463 length:915 start_codon:yes stop_codon:yes gene_type:complete
VSSILEKEKPKCIILLSEKSSGSSAFQNLLTESVSVKHVEKTRHYQFETLYWTKAASALKKQQIQMVDSEVPLSSKKAKSDLIKLLNDNLGSNFATDSEFNIDDIFDGWKKLCLVNEPVFLEKSPHHLCQWASLELILEAMNRIDEVDFLVVGLVRNPMDTIYSQYMRWGSHPEKVEAQWSVAYENLIRLHGILKDKMVLIRYEDITQSQEFLKPVFEFCGIQNSEVTSGYLHSNSISKWKNDNYFTFKLRGKTIQLAETFKYSKLELENTDSGVFFRVMFITKLYYKRVKSKIKHTKHKIKQL